MLELIASIMMITTIGAMAMRPRHGVLLLFAFFPVIAMAWRFRFAGFGLLDLLCSAVPLLVLWSVLTRPSVGAKLGTWLYLSIIYFCALTIGFLSPTAEAGIMSRADIVLRALNGVVGFIILPMLFRQSREFRRLLMTIMISGIPVILISFYQMRTGTVWREHRTVGLDRYQGLFHDAVAVRHIGCACLLAAFLFYYLYRPDKKLQLLLCIGYVVAWLPVLYKVYSKAGVLIFLLWISIWFVTQRRIILSIMVFGAFVVVNAALDSAVVEQTETLFSKEVDVATGEISDDRRIFAGRGYIWEGAIHYWLREDVGQKIIGTGSVANVHNEFLRILIGNGVIGLLMYLGLMTLVGIRLCRLYLHQATPINTAAVMAFAWWLVDCMGLHPGMYPYLQWIVWGIIGCALTGAPEMAAEAKGRIVLRRMVNARIPVFEPLTDAKGR